MPTTQTLTLQGVVRITENGNYNLVLPSNGIATQVGLPLQNEDVYIIIEPILGGVSGLDIILPKISDFNGGWNAKIHLLNKNEGSGIGSLPVLNSYSDSEILYSDFINTIGNQVYEINEYGFAQIVDTNFWGVLSA